MLFPTSTLLIENRKNDKNIEAFNTIKIDFSKLSSIQPSSTPFTQCPKCYMLLTTHDQNQSLCSSQNSFLSSSSSQKSPSIFSKQIQSENPKQNNFANKNWNMTKTNRPKVEEDSDPEKMKKWYCKYCKQENYSNGKLYFAPNNYKYVLQKNITRNLLPPLLLFLIDESGSMGQTITIEADLSQHSESNSKDSKYSSNYCATSEKFVKLSKELNDLIKKSQFYKKNGYKENRELAEIYDIPSQSNSGKNNDEKKNFYSKITFFMAVIEDYISNIKVQLSTQEFRVGFIFFNESIFILKPSRQKFIPTYSPINKSNNKSLKKFPFDEKFLDFHSFDQLFKEGQKFDRFFGDCKLKNLDFSKLMFQHLKTEGQTSLGPALVMALGMLSVHDIGSRLIVISDSKPNNGILANQKLQANEAVYEKIGTMIKQRQITLGVLNWIDEGNKNMRSNFTEHKIMDTINMQFDKFLKEYDRSLIQEIVLDFSIGFNQFDVLQRAKKTVIGLIKRGSLGRALKIDIKCDNPTIKIEKFKYDHIDFRFLKFLATRNKNWIQVHAFKPKESDFLFPICTQIVIRYEDIFTKQECLFMSYCFHKLSRVIPAKMAPIINGNLKKSQKIQDSDLEQEQVLQAYQQKNLKQLQSLQYINKFDFENVIPEAYSSKMSIVCQDTGEITDLQNRNNNTSLNLLAENINRINLDDEQDVYL